GALRRRRAAAPALPRGGGGGRRAARGLARAAPRSGPPRRADHDARGLAGRDPLLRDRRAPRMGGDGDGSRRARDPPRRGRSRGPIGVDVEPRSVVVRALLALLALVALVAAASPGGADPWGGDVNPGTGEKLAAAVHADLLAIVRAPPRSRAAK